MRRTMRTFCERAAITSISASGARAVAAATSAGGGLDLAAGLGVEGARRARSVSPEDGVGVEEGVGLLGEGAAAPIRSRGGAA